ncbi:hypothetical protein ACFV7Q_10705 [Streptomyces sp. NPDC059851]|uniref:hypothetical protein n=1 Tax=Streptomyces sp. NPDC059851 TaxID=3346971 RepID=UPI00365483BA
MTRSPSPPRTRPAAAGLPALLVCAALAGCGIKPTGVIESGAPAEVKVGGPVQRPLVYFVDPQDRLLPSPQDYSSDGVYGGVVRLLAGPSEGQKAAGLRTALPRVDVKTAAGARVAAAGEVVEVRLPFNVGPLSDLARRQLVCTALSTSASQYRAVLVGPDTTVEAAHCDAGVVG